MAKHIIDSDFTSTYEIKKSADDWTFTKDFSVTSTTYGIHVGANFDGNTIEIDGAVHGDQAGVFCESDDTTIHIGATAKLTGGAGIAVTGDNISVVNDSKIAAAGYGVFSGATHLTFTNENIIKADSAIYVVSDTHIVNAEGATIIGKTFAVSLGSSSLVNHGTITATQDAVLGGDGTTTVVNDGTITGNIDLGAGDDRFDNRGGVITNDMSGVAGSIGNDTLITDSAKVKLIEDFDQGTDTVKSTVSYKLSDNVERLFLLGSDDTKGTGTAYDNTIHGNSGNNVIKGLLGVDNLYGHKGNDILTGGGDTDVFHFSTGDGNDTVTDFTHDYDRVDVSGWKAITSFDELMQHHIAFTNGDAVITAGHDTLTLKGVAEGDLHASDFVFAV